MSKQKLLNTPVKTPAAQRLQQLLLQYHEFRHQVRADEARQQRLLQLSAWQTERLRRSHDDLYQNDAYRPGLSFLLSDLYAPKDFSQRDSDFERVFPKVVKWLPDSVIDTLALLIELNLLSHHLDDDLASRLHQQQRLAALNEAVYISVYLEADNFPQRARQIELVGQVGHAIEGYVHNRVLLFTLKATRGMADNAGLSELHDFLVRGVEAFQAMQRVSDLLDQISLRERCYLQRIYAGDTNPYRAIEGTCGA